MSDSPSNTDQQEDVAAMTVFQLMSRQPNYRTMRASERILKAWLQLPLFKLLGDCDEKPGIESIGFIRRVFHPQAKPEDPPFNSSMARAKRFEKGAIESLINEAAKGRDQFKTYVEAVERANPSHPSVRRAVRYFQNLLENEKHRTEELGVSAGLERIHHHALELYRRLPYTEVLNKFIYPILCSKENRERGPKALLFDAAWNWDRTDPDSGKRFKEEPLPGFMALAGAPHLPAEIQRNFEPFLPGENDETVSAVRKWHEGWFRSIEFTEGLKNAGDFLILAIPIREGWDGHTSFGSYLGHMALFLRRDRFYGSGDVDGQGRLMRMKELEEGRRAEIWAQMVRFHGGIMAFLNGDKWISPASEKDSWFSEFFKDGSLGRLHWEAIRRDLDDFVDCHFQSEFDEWLDIEFPSGATHTDVLDALQTVAKHTDGWTPVECQELKGDPVETEYKEHFVPYKENGKDLIIAVRLILRSETPEPGATPRNTLELCLGKDPDTIIPADPKARDTYFRRLWKRYNYLYQRLLRRAEFAAAGQQSGQSKTFHDYSKDLNVLEDQLQHYTKDVKGVREAVEQEAQALLALDTLPPTAQQSVQRMADQMKRLGDPDLDYMLRLQFLMSHLRVRTEGRLYEAPKWAWGLLESGTRWDIGLLIRAYVWRPFGWLWYDRELKRLPESTLDDDSITWSRIFLFDEDREESESSTMDAKVRGGISEVFRKLFFRWSISQADYEASFPPPEINPDVAWTDPVLWKMVNEAKAHHLGWLPPVRLLPPFIFAMRAAFEHAYLRNFFHVLDAGSPADVKGQKPRVIRVSESTGPNPGGAGIHHRIHIAFPALGMEERLQPLAEGSREPASLPYDNWSRHMKHYYRHACRPWHWNAERVSGSLEPGTLADTWHYEITLEARE